MCFFKKENKPKVCNHKWKDFPWYDVYGYNYESLKYYFKIKKPYVCVKCKQRHDEILVVMDCATKEERNRELEKYKEKYKGKLLDIVEVEEMVTDEQLVDRAYLKLLEEYENPKGPFDGLDLFAEIQKARKEAGVPPGISVQIGG